MNAAAQRRLTPILALTGGALAIVLVVFLAGLGRSVHWDEPMAAAPPPPARPAPMPTPVPLATFAEVWQRPLFNNDRKPVAIADGDTEASNIGDLELTGIIMTSGLRMALLRDKGKDVTVRVREGGVLEGHWTLVTLAPRSATFDNGGEHRELTLKVSAPEPLKDAPRRADAPPGIPPGIPSPLPPGGTPPRVQRPVSSSSMTGPNLPRPRQDDAALQDQRVEALKAAVQKRRAEQQQQAESAKEGVR
ncbi:general secretion pathway protein N [Luteibacter rhizovicinus]|uniref:General secretion pathway protein N n=1 Tax=Luteibacter rhizovicinus TaxID=242606 RepID=A0A4R3YIH7_9GAMM|nr:general secretion pathway protein GspN [Luteibacter rhizovicinus]TCV92016.1 general secretion pathway protein N [Luteibacter rhizovicinus]